MTAVCEVDTLVVGLGAMGSAALYHLARDGARPVGLEQFEIDHPFGSSHGPTRAIRTFYREQLYTELVLAALPLWRDLEAAAGERLLHECGTLFYARPGNDAFDETIELCRGRSLVIEELDAAGVAARLPPLWIPADATALLFPGTGFLDASRCVRAHARLAREAGAEIHERTAVRSLDLGADRPLVVTDQTTYRCRRLVITPGAWGGSLLADLGLPLTATRQEKWFFRPADPSAFGPDRIPVFANYDTMMYGFPFHAGAIGVAIDRYGSPTTPDTIDRTNDQAEGRALRAWLETFMPDSRPELVEAVTCMYPITPDYDFCIGPAPLNPAVVVAAGLEHGFKFATLVGRIVADLALTGETSYPIDRFRLDRFA